MLQFVDMKSLYYFCKKQIEMITTQPTLMTKRELLAMRDRRIVEEFYNLYEVKRLRLDDVLNRLSVEMFFLSPNYIYKRVFSVESNRIYYEQLIRNNQSKINHIM